MPEQGQEKQLPERNTPDQHLLEPALSTPMLSAAHPHKPSRRIAVAGLATLGGVSISGGMLWWVLTPHPLFIYRGHSGSVGAVAWSPDGKYIALGSNDHTVQVWDAK